MTPCRSCPSSLVFDVSNDSVIQRNAHPKAKRILGSTDIRQIGFGSATLEEYHSAVVSMRHYRAPEFILGNYQTAAAENFAYQPS